MKRPLGGTSRSQISLLSYMSRLRKDTHLTQNAKPDPIVLCGHLESVRDVDVFLLVSSIFDHSHNAKGLFFRAEPFRRRWPVRDHECGDKGEKDSCSSLNDKEPPTTD